MKTYRDANHIASAGVAHVSMNLACRIARCLGDKKPDYRWFMEKFGMSRATAYRWCRAWRDANGHV